jgi:hypothetical protein
MASQLPTVTPSVSCDNTKSAGVLCFGTVPRTSGPGWWASMINPETRPANRPSSDSRERRLQAGCCTGRGRRAVSEAGKELQRIRTQNRLLFGSGQLLGVPQGSDAANSQITSKVRIV